MSEPVRSVLVYSMGEVIGDGLVKLPVVGAVRDAFPDARITWCAAKGATVYAGPLAPVVAGCIDEVIATGAMGAGRWDWLSARPPFGGRRWDVVIDTQTNLRRSLVVRRAARTLFVSGAGGGVLSERTLRVAPPLRVVDRLLRLVSLAAGRDVPGRTPPLTDSRVLAAADALLPPGPVFIGFAPGSGGVGKRWPLDRYVELAARTARRGRTPVFFLGPQELDEQREVRAALPTALLPELDRSDAYTDIAGPLLVIALAGRLAAAVANDAGPGHMLAAGGAPLLSLQLDRRRAEKFRPAATRLEMLIAEDFGTGPAVGRLTPGPEFRFFGMATIPVSAVEPRLEALLEAPP